MKVAYNFCLQSYVWLKTTSGNDNYSSSTLLIQSFSIFISLYSISNKIVSDDKTMFIEKSGANQVFPPTITFIYRLMFRLCEVTANLFFIVIICVYFGFIVACVYFCGLVIINCILYVNGLLGSEWSHIFSYTIVMNLGVTPQEPKFKVSKLSCCDCKENKNNNNNSHNNKNQDKTSSVISNIFSKIIRFLFIFCFAKNKDCKLFVFNNEKYNHYLSYYYVMRSILSGFSFACVTLILFYTTDINDGELSGGDFEAILWCTVLLYVFEYVFYRLMFDSLHLGMLLKRDPKTLLLNYKIMDSIRSLKLQKELEWDQSENSFNCEIDVYQTIFLWILDENMILLSTDQVSRRTNVNHNNNNYAIPGYIKKHHVYFITAIKKIIKRGKAKNVKDFVDLY